MALQDILDVVPAGSEERPLVDAIDWTRLPRHVAVIMDGNGRWAKHRHKRRVEGHRAGIDSVRDVVETSARLGLEVLTLYAFSVENWKRPPTEVSTLMGLLKHYLRRELADPPRATTSGSRSSAAWATCRPTCRASSTGPWSAPASSTGLLFNIALNYGGRAEITDAVQRLLADVVANGKRPRQHRRGDALRRTSTPPASPTPTCSSARAASCASPTSCSGRSPTPRSGSPTVLWPDFRRRHLLQAIADYQKRERRYGGIGTA